MRLSVEGYPLISYYHSVGVTGTSFGAGTRGDYRLTPRASATLDLTSSVLGGSASVSTIELGMRLRPERNHGRAYPFVDFRVGYVAAFNAEIFDANRELAGMRYSSGLGALVGAGMEYDLTRRFSLTTAAAMTHHRMSTDDFRDASLARRGYGMTSVRYTVGIKYNPVRMVRVPGSDLYNRSR
jgi:hypothetical protein